ncbi:MAG: rRNA maturation RNase YbeY [Candidatus Eisenbacteria bacterium]|uniref:Endoribonuclease YbeY n=1 Tax=Eiseniibacteriota bacterium TaxID=2212470 RepID=A0A937XDQ3_UNCEI|nr:rRNA maturation RNase YbeY [Candidatus Eisenbacteria bacterium]
MYAARPPAVLIRNRQRKWKVDAARLRRLIARVLAGEPGGELGGEQAGVGLVLWRDEPVARLNARYRSRSGPTDVLSFPTDPEGWPPGEPRPLGEVVISVDRAAAQACERGLRLAAELDRLAVHGVLHLLGYDDDTPARRARMRRREDRHLRAASRR